MRSFAIFCRFQPKLWSQQFSLGSSFDMDHTACCTYELLFFRNFQMQFREMIFENCQILTFFNYIIILLNALAVIQSNRGAYYDPA